VPRKCPARAGHVTRVTCRTDDDVRLHGVVLQPGKSRTEVAIVVGHGFTNHVSKSFVNRVLQRLALRHTVIAFDFRGHGRSGGRCTAGPDEVHDLTAAVRLARAVGPGPVGTLGFSMGGTVALLQAASTTGADRPDAVVSVSSPSRWWVRQTKAMRTLYWLAERPQGRALLRTVKVRLARPLQRGLPASPVEVVERIGPTPLLLVHGAEDHYLPAEHAMVLHAAAGATAELWLRPGMRHAETAMTPELVDQLGGWLAAKANGAERAA
jgi:pimeloyl-ACP methyl ester carboxylesterase